MKKPQYNVIVPSLRNCGPVNVAFDISREMKKSGYKVQVYYLDDGVIGDEEGLGARKLGILNVFAIRGIVHSHGFRPDIISFLIKLIMRKKIRWWSTSHMHFITDLSFIVGRRKAKFFFRLWRFVMAHVDRLFCLSEVMIKYYRRHDFNCNIVLARNFRPLRRATISSLGAYRTWVAEVGARSMLRLVFVASFIHRKNVLALIKEVIKFPDIALVCCGDGPLLKEAAKIAAGNERILLLGHVADPSEMISGASVLVLPSLSEGLSLSLIEASALGKPCLLSDIGVHRELESLGLGVTFDHRNFSNFRSKLLQLTEDRNNFSPDVIQSKYTEYLSPQVGIVPYLRAVR